MKKHFEGLTIRGEDHEVYVEFVVLKVPSKKCLICSKTLDIFPRIILENQVYCYHCSKHKYKELIDEKIRISKDLFHEESKRYAQEMARYEKQVEQYNFDYKSYQERQDLRFSKWSNFLEANRKYPAVLSPEDPIMGLLFFFALVMTGGLSYLVWKKVPESKEYLRSKEEVKRLSLDFEKSNPIDFERPTEPNRPARKYGYHCKEITIGIDESCNDQSQISIGYDRNYILERDAFECQDCGVRFHSKNLEIHHVVPRAAGGSDCLRNLITLCYPCHLKEKWFGHRHLHSSR